MVERSWAAVAQRVPADYELVVHAAQRRPSRGLPVGQHGAAPRRLIRRAIAAAGLTRGAGRRCGPPRRATIRRRGRFRGRSPVKDSAGPALRVVALLSALTAVSQFYRASLSAIAPEVSRDLALSPDALGLANGVFFLALGVVQLPVGMVFDRVGPRRTIGALTAARGRGLAAPRRRHHRHRARRGPRGDRARLRGQLHGRGGALPSLVRGRALHHRAVVDLRALESRHPRRRHSARRGHRAGGVALGIRVRHRRDGARRRALPPARSRCAARPDGRRAPRGAPRRHPARARAGMAEPRPPARARHPHLRLREHDHRARALGGALSPRRPRHGCPHARQRAARDGAGAARGHPRVRPARPRSSTRASAW